MHRTLYIIIIIILAAMPRAAQANGSEWPWQPDAVVAQDGSGQYRSVQAAIDAAPAGRTAPWRILVKRGQYRETVHVPRSKSFIHLIGISADSVLIHYKLNVGKKPEVQNKQQDTAYWHFSVHNPLSPCHGLQGEVVLVEGSDFYAEGITFQNDWGVEHQIGPQALAIFTRGDRAAFRHCRFHSFQDTWQTSNSDTCRLYVSACWIEGAVDYFYGSGDAFVEHCTFHNIRHGSVITAPSQGLSARYGYVMDHCTVSGNAAAADVTKWGGVKLGRPWKNHPRCQWLHTTMLIPISPEGWTDMSATPLLFAEYDSHDDCLQPLDLSRRKTTYTNRNDQSQSTSAVALTAEQASALTYENVVMAGDGWNPMAFFTHATPSPIAETPLGWNDELYREIEGRIQPPTFPDRIFRPKLKTKASAAQNQKELQRTIDRCSATGGGSVVIPAGTYHTGAIRLKSDVNLVVERGAVLHFAFEPELYPLVRTRYEGLDLMNYSPCIYANGARRIAITGEGIIDGGGSNATFWQWTGVERFGYRKGVTKEDCKFPRDGNSMGYRALLQQMCDNGVPTEQRVFGMGKGLRMTLVGLVDCEDILIEGVTLKDSPFWVMHPLFSRNITVRRVAVENEGPNGDGCDPESCEDVLIEDCRFHTGDDCIAIKSGRNADGWRAARPSRNIIIRRCQMEDGHGGVVIGSEVSSGVENVFAEDCRMDSPNLDRVLRLKTNTCRGGEVRNVYMRNVSVGQCRESVLRINLNYQPNEESERGHTPLVHNVWMENVTCQKSRYGVQINGLPDTDAVYGIHLRNCRFDGVSEKPFLRQGQCHDIDFRNLMVNGQPVNATGSDVVAEAPYKSLAQWLVRSEMLRTPNPIYLDFTDSVKRPQGKWSYVMGIELEAMLDTWRRHADERIRNYVLSYPRQMISHEGQTTGYRFEDFNLDNVRTAHFILRADSLLAKTDEQRNGIALALATYFRQLREQPRTDDGVFWHKAIYHDQVWLDGIFMGLPYMALAAPRMAKDKAELQTIYDDITNQIATTFQRTFDPATGLWKHAWDSRHTMFWADPHTGQSSHTWARALGWFAMAQVEVLETLPEDYARRQELVDMLRLTMKAAIRYQDAATGCWRDVLDVRHPTNYLESSASCMLAYSLLKGHRLGLLDSNCRDAGLRAYRGIVDNFLRIDKAPSKGRKNTSTAAQEKGTNTSSAIPEGRTNTSTAIPEKENIPTLSLTRGVSVSGLGPESNPRRDGSFPYYMSEPVRDNDPKAIGPFLWATLEMERLTEK